MWFNIFETCEFFLSSLDLLIKIFYLVYTTVRFLTKQSNSNVHLDETSCSFRLNQVLFSNEILLTL